MQERARLTEDDQEEERDNGRQRSSGEKLEQREDGSSAAGEEFLHDAEALQYVSKEHDQRWNKGTRDMNVCVGMGMRSYALCACVREGHP